jgi:hypothetical protein
MNLLLNLSIPHGYPWVQPSYLTPMMTTSLVQSTCPNTQKELYFQKVLSQTRPPEEEEEEAVAVVEVLAVVGVLAEAVVL